MHGLQACCCFCIPHLYSVVKMLLKGEVGDRALNSHGNYIVDHGKSWNCVFEFLLEPCIMSCFKIVYRLW